MLEGRWLGVVFPRIREKRSHPQPPTRFSPFFTMSSGDGTGSEVSRGRGQETGARLSWTRSQMTFHSVCPPQLACTRPGDSQLPGTPAMSASLSSQPWSEHQWDRGDCPLISLGISHAPTTFPSTPGQGNSRAQRRGRGVLGILQPVQPPGGRDAAKILLSHAVLPLSTVNLPQWEKLSYFPLVALRQTEPPAHVNQTPGWSP